MASLPLVTSLHCPSFLFPSFPLSTNLSLTCCSSSGPAVLLLLVLLLLLLLSQPAAPALLSLMLRLVPGQSLRVTFDRYWQDRGEGWGTDSSQVTAPLWPGLDLIRPVLQPGHQSLYCSRVFLWDWQQVFLRQKVK